MLGWCTPKSAILMAEGVSTYMMLLFIVYPCCPGGDYWDYYLSSLSLSQITTIYLKTAPRIIHLRMLYLQMNCIDFTTWEFAQTLYGGIRVTRGFLPQRVVRLVNYAQTYVNMHEVTLCPPPPPPHIISPEGLVCKCTFVILYYGPPLLNHSWMWLHPILLCGYDYLFMHHTQCWFILSLSVELVR